MRYYAMMIVLILSTTITTTSAIAEDPVLIAHRGLLRHAPENTLPAFATCLELGIGFELDIRTTKDGKLVVLHDDTLNRTTDGPNRSAREFTLEQLKKFDAGSWFHPSFTGVRIPTLEETFALIQKRQRGQTIIALNVKDIPPNGEKQLVDLVEKYDLINHTFAFDQSEQSSYRFKAINNHFRIGGNVSSQDIETKLKQGLFDVFMLSSLPDAETLERLNKNGKQVVLNISGNDKSRRMPSLWTKAKQTGAEGILTDYPLELRLHWNRTRNNRKAIDTTAP